MADEQGLEMITRIGARALHTIGIPLDEYEMQQERFDDLLRKELLRDLGKRRGLRYFCLTPQGERLYEELLRTYRA